MHSFRPLLIFWAVLLCVLAAGAATLQYLGPPKAAQGRADGKAGHARAGQPAPQLALAPAAAPVTAPGGATTIPDPDPALQEPAIDLADRMLPRIADTGRTPAQAYAAAFDPGERHPRIALVIDGIGLDGSMSEQVLNTLPRAMDIVFSAYAPAAGAATIAAAARRQGRECLVSVPMEPSGFPTVEEGDRSLLTGGEPGQNRENLDWALSNVQGCVGATAASDGMGGERFAESRQAFGDVLSAIAHRGLLYLDPRPGAPPPEDPTLVQALPRVVDVVVDRATSADEPASAASIDQNLAKLERLAAERGSAIGLAGPPRIVLLERLAVWANGLPARGMVLAPLTAIAPPRPPAQETSP